MKNIFTANCVHELALARKAWKHTTKHIDVMLSEREASAFPDAKRKQILRLRLRTTSWELSAGLMDPFFKQGTKDLARQSRNQKGMGISVAKHVLSSDVEGPAKAA